MDGVVLLPFEKHSDLLVRGDGAHCVPSALVWSDTVRAHIDYVGYCRVLTESAIFEADTVGTHLCSAGYCFLCAQGDDLPET